MDGLDLIAAGAGTLFFLASMIFWGRVFAGERLRTLWPLFACMAVAGTPLLVRSVPAMFGSVVLAFAMLVFGEVLLMKRAPEPVRRTIGKSRWTGEGSPAVWDVEQDDANQRLLDNYERSKGALVFDDDK